MSTQDPNTSPTAAAGVAPVDPATFVSLTNLPDQIGGYRVLRAIARGGMAEVYEVADPATGEHLAIKLLVASGVAQQRFNREYEAMIRLNHPNIVRVFNYGLEEGAPWFTMELITGMPVQGYAKRLGRPGTKRRMAQVIRIIHDLALALDHIHRRELLHRDLKSANVLVLPDGRVKLIDFGTARVADPYEEITQEGEFIGTFAYASPEQIRGGPTDGRSDLYSLGILLYRLTTGKRPFPGDDPKQLIQAHFSVAPRPPSELIPSIPTKLEDLILSLLAKDPDNRPRTGAEVAQALEVVTGESLRPPGTIDVDQSADRVVGREAQLRQILAFLADTERTMAMAIGLPGSGRTRLLRALEPVNRSKGGTSCWIHFFQGQPPLQPWSQLLEQLANDTPEPRPDTVNRARQAGSRLARATGKPLAERLAGICFAIVEVLLARQTTPGLQLVLINSLEHAGAAGLEGIKEIEACAKRLGLQMKVLATCDERADAPRSHLHKTLPDALRVPLPALSQRDVGLLVGALLHRRPPPAAIVRRIHEATGGLPAYVEEVVHHLVDEGLLRIRGHDLNRIEWSRREDLPIPLPERARQSLEDVLASMPADRRRVLEALVFAGGDAPLTVIAKALQCRPAQIVPSISDLKRIGWIHAGKAKGVRYLKWRHMLAERIVREHVRPARRRVMEKLLLEQLRGEPPFLEQIRMLIRNGEVLEALERSLSWGIHQLAKQRPLTALMILDSVIPVVETADVQNSLKARLHLVHVAALLLGRPADTSTGRSLGRAAAYGKGLGDGFQAELSLTRATTQRVIGHYPNFRKHLQKAWDYASLLPEGGLAMSITNQLAWSERLSGSVDGAASWHGKARRIANGIGTTQAIAMADSGVAAWQYARGLIAQSERTARGAIQEFDAVGDTGGLSEVLPVWAHALRQQGRFSEALAVLYQQLPMVRTSEVPTYYVRLLLAAGWCELDICRLGRAQEIVDELGASLRRSEHLDLRLEADLLWGRVQLASGMPLEAERTLKSVYDPARSAGLQVLAGQARALRGELRATLGDPKEAQKTLRRAVDDLEQTGDIPATCSAIAAASRALATVEDPDLWFKPVERFLETEPASMMRLELGIARTRWAQQQQLDTGPLVQATIETLHTIARRLSDSDRAALDLHPYARETRAFG